jgi:hypothetical protein
MYVDHEVILSSQTFEQRYQRRLEDLDADAAVALLRDAGAIPLAASLPAFLEGLLVVREVEETINVEIVSREEC